MTFYMYVCMYIVIWLCVPETFRVKIFSAFWYFLSCWKYFYSCSGKYVTCTVFRNPVALALFIDFCDWPSNFLLISKKKPTYQLIKTRIIQIPSNFIYPTWNKDNFCVAYLKEASNRIKKLRIWSIDGLFLFKLSGRGRGMHLKYFLWVFGFFYSNGVGVGC